MPKFLFLFIISTAFISCKSSQNLIEEDLYFGKDTFIGTKTGQVVPIDYKYLQKNSFKVLSWNVEHFLDPYDDPYIENDRENNSALTMENKVDLLVNALRKANADVVVLQEFESAKFLQKIASESLQDMGYRFFADAPSHTWYMNVVVMSKVPLGILYGYGNVTTPVINYKNEDGNRESQNQLNTRMWSVEVYPSKNYNFLLTGVHLKAGRGDRNIAMRKGQINFLKQQFYRFLKEDKKKNLLIVGDFNSTPESEEIALLTNSKKKTLQFIDHLPKNKLSHPADDLKRRLDYILMNTNMSKAYLNNSIQVPFLFSSKKMRQLSDHLPIIASFEVN